ncbi:MAG: leucine-rich repeat domain-containing protein [Chitinispirillaceae bacterium]|nr:leucine-rich repeat domain-containing protein [Chitinispirillaceae bacterium]
MNRFSITLRTTLFTFGAIVLVRCSLITPEHEFDFPERRLHSWRPGSLQTDSAAVLALLALNNIPFNRFDDVAEIGPDLRVYSLDFSGMGIDTLSDTIGTLGALTNLDISGNRLTTLPDSIIKLTIRSTQEVCNGPCGSSDCCSTVSYNGLILDHNRLCSLPASVTNWVDSHFNRFGYLASDTTQQCE